MPRRAARLHQFGDGPWSDVALPRLRGMRISVFGCGYLGAVHAACMASLGHEVVGVDVIEEQVAALAAGRAPFYEPGLERAARRGAGHRPAGVHHRRRRAPRRGGALHLRRDAPEAQRERRRPRLRRTPPSTASCRSSRPGDVVVGKSTVPVGTAEVVAERIEEREPDAELVWNPEFLREGKARRGHAAPRPLRVRRPARRGRQRAARVLDEVYAATLADGHPEDRDRPGHRPAGQGRRELVPGHQDLLHQRDGRALRGHRRRRDACWPTRSATTPGSAASSSTPASGFGGGCLPKDIRAFMARAGELGADQALTFLREVDSINMRRRVRMVDLAREVCGGSIVGRRIAVLGAAFKPDSDDIRDSPALSVAAQMQLQGAQVTVTDPQADRQRPQEVAGARLRRDRRRTRSATPRWCWCSPSGRSTSRSTRRRSTDQVVGRRGSSTAATASTRPPGAPPAGPTGALGRP